MFENLLDAIAGAGSMARPAVVALVVVGLWIGAGRAGFAPPARRCFVGLVAAALVSWLFAAEMLARLGMYSAQASRLPLLPAAIAAPLALGLLLALRSRRLAMVLDAVPAAWLVGLQAYRVFGFVFLVQWARGLAPAIFALPAGIGDIATGLLAIASARGLASRRVGAERRAVAWNALGILDLVAALILGFLSSPGPFQLLALELPNRLAYPLVLIPTFAVPLSLMLHAASLRQIARSAARLVQGPRTAVVVAGS